MRFVDLLRAVVVLSAGAATSLGIVCIVGAAADDRSGLVGVACGWWVVATVVGSYLGRLAQTSPPVARLLADAKPATMMPDHRPGAVLLNRLWPLALSTLLATGVAFLLPQVPGIAAGFAIILALTWRRQAAAVSAVQERDGVVFYVAPTSPLKPIALVRMPGLRREAMTQPS